MRKMILLGVLMSAAGSAAAIQSASNMSYQGKLLGAGGIPLNGNVNICFAIYNSQAGAGSGTCPRAGYLWNETINNVPVSNGVFAVQLGNVVPGSLTPQVFSSSPTYLGVGVGTDLEMTPLQLLSASPYAFSAGQLVNAGSIAINSGVAFATFTTAGNLQLPFGIIAASATFSSTVTVNGLSGPNGYSLQLSSGILMTNGTLSANIVTASSGIFTGLGDAIYSITTSSGILVSGTGGVTASFLAANQAGNAVILSGAGANIAFTGAGAGQITTASGQNLALMPGGTGKVGIGTAAPGIALSFGNAAAAKSFGIETPGAVAQSGGALTVQAGGAGSGGGAGGNLVLVAGNGVGANANGAISMTLGTGGTGANGYVEVAGGAGGSHLRSTQTTAPTGAGGVCTWTTNPTPTGTDMAGSVTMKPSSSAKCTNTITFNKAYAAAPKAVILTPAVAATITVQPYISATAAGTFTVTFNVASTAGTTYTYYYLVIE